jgi:hypothetical protein
LREMLEKTSFKIFSHTNTSHHEGTKMMPTGSSCLQATRKKGGALGMFEPLNLESTLSGDCAVKLGRLRNLNIEVENWRKVASKTCKEKILNDFKYETLNLEAVSVPEPSKFRIITKGDGHLYTLLQPLQGLMLDDWKRQDFSTMLDEDLTEKINKIDRNCRTLEYFCSVDYEAATDLIKKDATLCAFSVLKDAPLYEIAMTALSGSGVVHYPDIEGQPEIHPVDQIDGQLMGHPLSFPLLCTINLAVFRTAIKRWINQSPNSFERRCRKERGRAMWENVIVNGDDMLFKCESSFYEIFCKTAADAGLKLSLGKNYLSRDMCMINSQVFKRVGKVMQRQGYLNLRFIKGGDSYEGILPTQVSLSVNKMLNLCPWTKCSVPAFLKRWSDDYIGFKYRPNWYLPVFCGGLGLDMKHAPGSLKITKEQLKVAQMMKMNPSLSLYRSLGIKLPLAKLACAILNWKRVPKFDVLNESDRSIENNDPWLNRLALAVRFSQTKEIRLKKDEKALYEISNDFRDLRKKTKKNFTKNDLCDFIQTKLVAVAGPECPPLQIVRV